MLFVKNCRQDSTKFINSIWIEKRYGRATYKISFFPDECFVRKWKLKFQISKYLLRWTLWLQIEWWRQILVFFNFKSLLANTNRYYIQKSFCAVNLYSFDFYWFLLLFMASTLSKMKLKKSYLPNCYLGGQLKYVWFPSLSKKWVG